MANTASKRGRLRLRILIPCIAALLLGVLLAALLLFPRSSEPGNSEPETEISFVAAPNAVVRPLGKGILSLSATGFSVYNRRGESGSLVPCTLSNPVVCIGEKQFLAYGRGSARAVLADSAGITAEIAAPGRIIHGALSASGRSALVTDSEYHKGALTLCDAKGGVLFSYKSSDAYPYLCAVSPSGNLLACALLCETEDGLPASALYTFSPDREAIVGRLVLENAVIDAIFCQSDDRITVVTDRALIFTDRAAEVKARYDLADESILFYAALSDSVFLMTEQMTAGARYAFVSVGTDGRELARSLTNTAYSLIAGGKDCVALLSDREVTVLDASLRLRFSLSHAYFFTDLAFSGDNELCCRCDSGVMLYHF